MKSVRCCFGLIFVSLFTSHTWSNHTDNLDDVDDQEINIDDTSISTGREHSCSIDFLSADDFSGEVKCWGFNHYGQTLAPTGQFIQVSLGQFHSCAIKRDQTVQCWGHPGAGSSPRGRFSQISCGDQHCCGILTSGKLNCWGQNFEHQASPPNGMFVQVSAGKLHTCGLKFSGQAECWGEPRFGKLDVPVGKRFHQISAAPGQFTCGVTTGKRILCWGRNHVGQCTAPQDVEFTQVSTARMSACGIQANHEVRCWGFQDAVTVGVPKDTEFDEISLAWDYGCGILRENGQVKCWGKALPASASM